MARFFFIGIALIIMGFITHLLRSRKLREKYAALWLAVGIVGLVLAIFPGILEGTAQFFGVVVPANLLFVLALLLLLGVCLHLSLEISRLEDETRVLAEHVAILQSVATRAGLMDTGAPRTAPDQDGGTEPGEGEQPQP